MASPRTANKQLSSVTAFHGQHALIDYISFHVSNRLAYRHWSSIDIIERHLVPGSKGGSFCRPVSIYDPARRLGTAQHPTNWQGVSGLPAQHKHPSRVDGLWLSG